MMQGAVLVGGCDTAPIDALVYLILPFLMVVLPTLGFKTAVNNDVWSDSDPVSTGLALDKRKPSSHCPPANTDRPPPQECWTSRTQPQSQQFVLHVF
jgi:hypothetical protein